MAYNAAYHRQYQLDHAEEIAAYNRRYRQENKDRIKVRRQLYARAHRPQHRAWVQRRNAALLRKLEAIRLEEGCIDCGYRENADALQFDHVRGTKTANVASLLSSVDALSAEVLKCDVRCANCHAINSAEKRRQRDMDMQAHYIELAG